MASVCEFCCTALEPSDGLRIIDQSFRETLVGMMDALYPNSAIVQQDSIACHCCIEKINSAFTFKKSCSQTELTPGVPSNQSLAQKKEGTFERGLCRLCRTILYGPGVLLTEFLEKEGLHAVFQTHFSEINLQATECPTICSRCEASLLNFKHLPFISNCFKAKQVALQESGQKDVLDREAIKEEENIENQMDGTVMTTSRKGLTDGIFNENQDFEWNVKIKGENEVIIEEANLDEVDKDVAMDKSEFSDSAFNETGEFEVKTEIKVEDEEFVNVGGNNENKGDIRTKVESELSDGVFNETDNRKLMLNIEKEEMDAAKLDLEFALLKHEEIHIKSEEMDTDGLTGRDVDSGKVALEEKNVDDIHKRYTHTEGRSKNNILCDYEAEKNFNECMEKKSDVQIYKCADCQFETKSSVNLEKHVLLHKNALEEHTFKCEECPYETKYKHKLNRHSLIHKDKSEVRMHKCSKCSFETKHVGSLTIHSVIHKDKSEIQMYYCGDCSYETKYKYKLKRHSLVHKDKSEVRMYNCGECPYETKFTYELRRHSLIHKDKSEVQMYKCGLCSYETKFKQQLNNHSLVHKDKSEVPMYQCTNCSFETKHVESLKLHLLIHKDKSEIRMYQCEQCPYETRYVSGIRRHLLLHKDKSEVQMHKCGECPYETKLKYKLKRHSLVHKGKSKAQI